MSIEPDNQGGEDPSHSRRNIGIGAGVVVFILVILWIVRYVLQE